MRWTRTSNSSGIEPAGADPGLRVDPTAVGSRQSTAGLVAAAAIAVLLGLAVVKPWVPATSGVAPRSGDAVTVAVAVTVAPSPPSPAPAAEDRPRPDAAGPAGIASATRPVRVADWARLAAADNQLAGQPIVTDHDLGGTDGDGTCGGSARITPFDELFAIVATPGEKVAAVRVYPIDSIGRTDIPTRIVRDRPGPLDGRAFNGLTVVALPPGGIAARQYGLIAETTGAAGPERRTYTICVG